MFENNSYFPQSYNYSFQDEEDLKENNRLAGNINENPKNQGDIMQKLNKIQLMMNKQYQLEKQNRMMLLEQANKINQMEKKLNSVYKIVNEKAQKNHSIESIGGNIPGNSRIKSESTRTCKNKRSADKPMLCSLEERQKAINSQIQKRIKSQLCHKQQKKPLKFFIQQQ